jgi:DNA-directed RNA polymerase subunit RPC12/RpoP
MRLIDADGLADDFLHDSKDAGFYRAIYEGAARRVKAAPTIDYEPVVHSQWLLHEMHPKRVTVDGYVVCPECKHNFDRIKGTWFKRCPECGAKMDGGK